eukprot:m.135769 g.135769  ORF g.135769 m.135769 type:complete len:266 (+) comp14877_c0_seq1:166-963(+)
MAAATYSSLARGSPPTAPLIIDEKSLTYYTRGKYLGKGAFAKCYELQRTQASDKESGGQAFAGKVIAKSKLIKHKAKEKLTNEIKLHKTLSHENVVKFFSFFEDDKHVYIILELCTDQTLLELLKEQPHLSEPSSRFLARQLAAGMVYIHSCGIVHRDLKLGNTFLTNNCQVLKIGDFGMALPLEEALLSKSMNGTPNYFSPEALAKTGYTPAVDVWAFGVILYAMLVGVSPFAAPSIPETYVKISAISYSTEGLSRVRGLLTSS